MSFELGYTYIYIKNLCIRSNSITLILPQTKFEAIPSEDVRGDTFLVQLLVQADQMCRVKL